MGSRSAFRRSAARVGGILAVQSWIRGRPRALGDLLTAKGQAQAALPHYREAVRIQRDFGRAHLGLGLALAAVGDVSGAVRHLQKAAADSDSAVHSEAAQMLRQLGKER
jgi:Flp pilus assembly protein TadD